MKYKYVLAAGILALCIAASGCGKEKEEATDTQNEATIETSGDEDNKENDNVVEMQQSDETDISNIKNIIGTKTATASYVVINNETGLEISEIFIRPTSDGDEWGTDLVSSKFTLKDKDKAVYYYEKNETDDSGSTVKAYDIQVAFQEEDEVNCYFRELPFSEMQEVTLKMQEGVPYVTYFSTSAKKEVSTLEDAKKRMGLSETDSSDSTDSSSDTSAPSPTQAPSDNSNGNDSDNNGGSSDGQNDGEGSSEQAGYDELVNGGQGQSLRSEAENYIGQSYDDLTGACGSANSDSTEEDPEIGEVHYYYYDDFTVSTSVVDGQEVVTQIW